MHALGGIMRRRSGLARMCRPEMLALVLVLLDNWMSDTCPGAATAPAGTEECMAHQSCASATDHDGDRSNCGAGRRALSERSANIAC